MTERPETDPETLASPDDEIRASARYASYHGRLGPRTADLRYVHGNPLHRAAEGDRRPHQDIWMRPYAPVTGDPVVVAAALAHLSDVNLLSTPLLGRGLLGDGSDVIATSFDHVLRYHHLPASLDWTHYRQHSTTDDPGRPEAHGRMSTADGILVATVNQQGVLVTARTPTLSSPTPPIGEHS